MAKLLLYNCVQHLIVRCCTSTRRFGECNVLGYELTDRADTRKSHDSTSSLFEYDLSRSSHLSSLAMHARYMSI